MFCFSRISAQGLLVSKMLPAVQRYQEKPQDEQYQIRRSMRAAQHLVNILRNENTVCSEPLEPQLIIRKSTAAARR